ncbi:glycosyltransferase [Methylotenera sp.]|uniref:glycosyltransferase n=1 Tax=Methylotenera sp. TaxID=2051956 RepID=UPI002487FEE4|nr:glycosyltransferase [Methylotenera sp.]MDI1298692.1 glycosyltransferase [Methylotenera sp.]
MLAFININSETQEERSVIMTSENTQATVSSLGQLLSVHDEQFVHLAYQSILGRRPDHDGFKYYLLRLRGGVSKLEIISQLYLSAEGKSRKVSMTGLDVAIKKYKQSKLPIWGALLRFLGFKEIESTEKKLRVLENALYLYNKSVQKKLSEFSIRDNQLQETTLSESEEAYNLKGNDIVGYTHDFTPYDPIGDRYKNTLAEVKLRFSDTDINIKTNSNKIKISLVMPVYKVPIHFLKKAIYSIQSQSYANWELCIVDDGSNDKKLAEFLHNVASMDKRIKIQILNKNNGISSATNEAISMTTGHYIGFIDNDDILTRDALAHVANVIDEYPEVDLVYSDEAKIDEDDNPIELFTKPDWSPSTLFNCMYVGHFSVYKGAIVKELGGLRSEYDFSQDYDFTLRASELVELVHHIPKVLYGWRMISGSGAQGDKPYARVSNIAALQDALDRRGLKGKVIPEPAANRFIADSSNFTEKVSLIIPSDNFENITQSIKSIVDNSLYSNYEIIVVTNSKIIQKLKKVDLADKLILVAYDGTFNFSTKCNLGAVEATGEIIVFFNDDVRVVSKDWIERLLEGFLHKNVGIVGPKLLYENYLIQHAGMVTGVRGLVGTAFHCLPHETHQHFGAALWLREVSLICGACLAIRKDIFEQINGFDDVNAGIAHSDVDLCFKVREAGYTCLYTPHATLIHIGHLSIAEAEKAEAKEKLPPKKDKSDIYLLRRWGKFTSYDPYFPPAMRDILYHDSPEKWNLFADVDPAPVGGKDYLLISHDLTGSGAPRIVYEMARTLKLAGNFVVVASPSDGEYREKLNELNIPVIIDELTLRQHNSLEKLAKNFDIVIANTIVSWPAVKQLSSLVETYWYIHEISLVTHLLNVEPEIKNIFKLPKQIWVGSPHAGDLIKQFRSNIRVLKYGVDPITPTIESSIEYPLRVSVFGSYEPRKGQDLAIQGYGLLEKSYQEKIKLNFYGRVLDHSIYDFVKQESVKYPNVGVHESLEYNEYLETLLKSDAVLVASRDDTLPFVSIDALGAGKVLLCTSTTGTSLYIENGVSGFVLNLPDPKSIAKGLTKLVDQYESLPSIMRSGRAVFDKEFSFDAFSKALLSQGG